MMNETVTKIKSTKSVEAFTLIFVQPKQFLKKKKKKMTWVTPNHYFNDREKLGYWTRLRKTGVLFT